MERKALKTTSGTGRGHRGFSLLEILIVLAIIILFSGFFVLRFNDGDIEQKLSSSSTSIQALALKAKKRAYTFRREQFIVFSDGGAVLSDSSLANSDSSAGSQIIESVDFPDDVRVEILPHSESEWRKLETFVWTFRDSGLSEPIGLRFSIGRAYSKLDFHVLTARAEEESFYQ
ncbi:MAG: prepilin-type N-terminal cleavage/methylation domain-containing protein [Verrucomicrobiota bacterium]